MSQPGYTWSMSNTSPLTVTIAGPVGRITLDRPEAKNALGPDTLAGLRDALLELEQQEAVRVIVLDGRGAAFSVGFDLRAMASMVGSTGVPSESDLRASATLGQELISTLRGLRTITVASVHGSAVGGGFLLAAACDFRIVSDDTLFSIPELDIGLPLLWGGVPLLVSELGINLTRELILTCRRFGPADLDRTHFIYRCVPESRREEETQTLIALLCDKPPAALRLTKDQLACALEADDGSHSTDPDRLISAVVHPDFMATAMRYIQRIRKKG